MPISRAACMLVAIASIAGCTHDTMLLEGDIPLPEGLVTVRSADIRRSGGEVTGGRFILSGEIGDASAAMDRASVRFSANGWSRAAIDGDASFAKARFVKGGRTVELELLRRGVDPRNSQGVLSVAAGGS
jgi:hypothetical protein